MSVATAARAGSTLGVVVLACLAPWPFASVEPFWSALACGLVLAVAIPALLAGAGTDRLPREALIAAAAGPLVALVSVVPLPAAVVGVLSPSVPGTLGRAGVAPDGWATLSLFAPAGRDALVLAAACAVAAWLVASAAVDERRRRRLSWTFLAGGVLLAVFGLAQRLIDPDPQRMFWSVRIYEVATPFGPYVNRNHFGGAMLLFTGVAAGRALAGWGGGGRRESVLAAGAALVCGLALLATASRGAVLGLAVLVVVLLAAAPGRRRLRLAMVVVVAAALLVLLLASTGLLDELAGRLFRMYGRWRNRFLVQADALRVALEFPLFGTGPGTFPWVYHAFQRVDDVRHFNDAHSDWVQLLMDGGLVGLGAVAVVVRALARAARRAWRCADAGRWHALGAVAGCSGLAAHGFFETNLHIPANALLAAVVAGVAYGSSLRPGPVASTGSSEGAGGAAA